MRFRFSYRYLLRQTRRSAHKLWLSYGIFWIGAILVGLISVAYAKIIDGAFELFSLIFEQSHWSPLALSPAVGVLAVWLTRRYFPGSEGSGIPQVMATVQSSEPARRDRLLSLRVIVGKIVVSTLAVFGGFTIGREGPSVHVGASLMYTMRFAYPRSSSRIDRQFIVAGGAAGLAAAFNAPLAGVVFAFEELSKSFEQRTSGTLITAILFSGVVALALAGNYSHFSKIAIPSGYPPNFVFAALVTAAFTGISGGFFSWLLLNTMRWMPRWLRHTREAYPYRFALLCGLLIGVIGVAAGGITFGSGYHEAQVLLSDEQSLSPWYAPLKIISLLMTYLIGMPGGIFAPTLSIGAGLGQLAHFVFPDVSLQALIALAMVGYLAAVTQAPITSFVIMMEMTDGHEVVVWLMATALIASTLARAFTKPLYERLSEKYHGDLPEPARRRWWSRRRPEPSPEPAPSDAAPAEGVAAAAPVLVAKPAGELSESAPAAKPDDGDR